MNCAFTDVDQAFAYLSHCEEYQEIDQITQVRNGASLLGIESPGLKASLAINLRHEYFLIPFELPAGQTLVPHAEELEVFRFQKKHLLSQTELADCNARVTFMEHVALDTDDKLQLERDAQNKVEEAESSLVNVNARLNDASRGLVETGQRLQAQIELCSVLEKKLECVTSLEQERISKALDTQCDALNVQLNDIAQSEQQRLAQVHDAAMAK